MVLCICLLTLLEAAEQRRRAGRRTQRVLGAADGEVPPGYCRSPAPSCWDSRGERRGGGEGERGESAGVGEMAGTEGCKVPPANAGRRRLEWGRSRGGHGGRRAAVRGCVLRRGAASASRERGAGQGQRKRQCVF